MKPLLTAVLLVLASSASLAFAQNKSPAQDGLWWNQIDPSIRLGYVLGYTQGAESANINTMTKCLVLWTDGKSIKENYSFEQWRKICMPQGDFDGIPMGQFVDGLNAFYADYRNQKIDVGWALGHVRDGIKGKTETLLEADVEMARKCATDPENCLKQTPQASQSH